MDTKEQAREVLRGVITIAENEMLTHSIYISGSISNPALAEAGAVCGGRQACLLGAVALAGTKTYADAEEVVYDILAKENDADEPLHNRAVEMALEALDAEAEARLEREDSSVARSAQGWPHPCEGYFEQYLEGASYATTRKAIVALASAAIQRLA